MDNEKSSAWKTAGRITVKVFMRVLYITSAFLISVALSLFIVYKLGLHYYDNYYKEYLTVQQSWTNLDEGYIDYINILKKNIDTIEAEVVSKDFRSKNQENYDFIEKKMNVLKTDLPAADYSMSYQDKFSTYPSILLSANELIYYLESSTNEEIQQISSELKEIQKNITKEKLVYNKLVVEFNQINTQFPEKYFSEIGSFEDWPEFK